jgi:cytosine/adenosine deaminase-related metal-dependent hydrolase
MKYITADRIYKGYGGFLENTVLVIDNQTITDIISLDDIDNTKVEHLEGIITPGFINAHCHLELSHMIGKLKTGTGLLSFIGNVVKQRGASEEDIQAAIYKADNDMYESGIAAVGDISNVADTVACKSKSKLNYYTFVEIFDFMQAHLTKPSIEQYGASKPLFEKSKKDKTSYTPHAPYSVSVDLLDYINKETKPTDTISIHNQETPPENELFEKGSGAFYDFYKGFDLSLDHFTSNGKTAIHYILNNIAQDRKMLFVHNTLSTKADIEAAQKVTEVCYWASCPNANLYIENRLPDYQTFIDTDAKVCIGTDSLTSNWQLNILEEMKTIQKYNSFVNFDTLITWACKNGADALGFDHLGRIKKGMTPGIVQITGFSKTANGDINIQSATSKRII